ncbi:FAD-dependent oxidoreductase [Streptomyces sp. NPDC059398]|uniref:FAD-dependent oxidoreductase n=1 Tax=Streptomyces sp. NPDC059398 TaxID=3346820 RepID=UPI0036D03B82
MLSARGHAVVIGAGATGLMAAHALADLYAWVTLLEQDRIVTGDDTAPEYGRRLQTLGILSLRDRAVERLLPGFLAALRAAGAPAADLLGGCRWYLGDSPLDRRDSGQPGISMSRAFLVRELRRRLLTRPGVGIVDSSTVTGLVLAPSGNRVTGVRVRPQGEHEQVVEADLVVDASGAAPHSSVWLSGAAPAGRGGGAGLSGGGYVIRRYRLPAGALGSDIAVVAAPSDGVPRYGCLAREENERWALSLGSLRGDLPRDSAHTAYLRFTRGLAVPDIHEALHHAEPLDDPAPVTVPHRPPQRARRAVPRLVVLSDWPDRFGPANSRSVTAAALESLLLRGRLAGVADTLGARPPGPL